MFEVKKNIRYMSIGGLANDLLNKEVCVRYNC